MKDREPVKSTVIGRPILLALEDVDGTPSFLEKALTFIEEHGGFSYIHAYISVCVCVGSMLDESDKGVNFDHP